MIPYTVNLKLIEEREKSYVKCDLNVNSYSDFTDFKKTAVELSVASFLYDCEYIERHAKIVGSITDPNRIIKAKIAPHNLALFFKAMSKKLTFMIDNAAQYDFISYNTLIFAHGESGIRIKFILSCAMLTKWLTRLYSMDNFYKVSDVIFTDETPVTEGINLIIREDDFVSVLMDIADFTTIIL